MSAADHLPYPCNALALVIDKRALGITKVLRNALQQAAGDVDHRHLFPATHVRPLLGAYDLLNCEQVHYVGRAVSAAAWALES
jgi:hypothetical protein